MAYERKGAGALDYLPCRYGASKLLFRGPKRDLSRPYIAFLGGSETYGRFVPRPFPARLEDSLPISCVNFGYPNAGVDAYTSDPDTLRMAAQARVTVLQVMGAQNLSNRFFRVHPRRNDRFLKASTMLEAIYREVDFTEFHFTRHMLGALARLSSDRFGTVRTELQQAWIARNRLLLRDLPGKTVLLWITGLPYRPSAGPLGPDPLFIERAMVDEVAAHVTELVEVRLSEAARDAGTRGMVLGPMDDPAAAETMGPIAHEEVAAALRPALLRLT